MQRLEVSGAVRPMYGSLGVERLNNAIHILHHRQILRALPCAPEPPQS